MVDPDGRDELHLVGYDTVVAVGVQAAFRAAQGGHVFILQADAFTVELRLLNQVALE